MSCDFPWSVVFEVVSVIAFAGSGSLSGCSMCAKKGTCVGGGLGLVAGGKGRVLIVSLIRTCIDC